MGFSRALADVTQVSGEVTVYSVIMPSVVFVSDSKSCLKLFGAICLLII